MHYDCITNVQSNVNQMTNRAAQPTGAVSHLVYIPLYGTNEMISVMVLVFSNDFNVALMYILGFNEIHLVANIIIVCELSHLNG